MSVPPRTPAPSAMDGYRRITRSATDDVPEDLDVQRRGVRRGRRVAGATRIIGLLAVIVVIAGTSFGLATAKPKSAHHERTANEVAASAATTIGPVLGPTAPQARAKAHAAPRVHVAKHVTPKPIVHAKVTPEPVAHVQATPVAPRASAAAAPTPAATHAAPAAELPFTGASDVLLMRMLLLGATLALLGMAVQIAGTPLPAQANDRKRLASRET